MSKQPRMASDDDLHQINLAKFSEIGRSRLKRQLNPTGLHSSLILRELGNSYFRDCWDLHRNINRQLLKSRAPEEKKPAIADTRLILQGKRKNNLNVDLKSSQWIRTELLNGTLKRTREIATSSSGQQTGIKQYASFVSGKIVIKDQASNTRRFYTPHPSLTQDPLHWDYSFIDTDPDQYKWRDFDVWYTGSIMETTKTADGDTKIPKIPNTLFVLENKKLVLYNFNTGQKLDELSLSFANGPPHYSRLVVDNEENRIYIMPPKTFLPGSSKNEFLVLSYPPLKVLYRILIPNGAFGKGVTGVENIGRILISSKSTVADVYDLDELPQVNEKNSTELEAEDCSHPSLAKMQTIKVLETPKILLTIKTHSGMVGVVPLAWPPHVFVKSKDKFEVYSIGNMDKKVYEIQNKTTFGDVEIQSYDQDRNRLQVSKLLHGFDLLEVVAVDGCDSKVTTVFTTEGLGENTPSTETVTTTDLTLRRSGLRNISKKSYCDTEVQREFAFAYELNLDMFACCMVFEETLFITVYDNSTNKIFKKLQPVKLTRPKKFKEVHCSSMEVAFEIDYISVQLTLYDPNSDKSISVTELYTVKLLGEVVKEQPQEPSNEAAPPPKKTPAASASSSRRGRRRV